MKKLSNFSLLGLNILLVLIFSCDDPNFQEEVQLSKPEISEIKALSAVAISQLINPGIGVMQHGHCWSTSQLPTLENSHTECGSSNVPCVIQSDLTPLQANKTYYVRTYARTFEAVVYGEQVEFQTLEGGVTFSTPTAFDISTDKAMISVTIESDGGNPITSRGVCWNITTNPTVEDNTLSGGEGTGSYSVSITGLEKNTTYYAKAWAENELGVSYSEQIPFTTAASGASVNTSPVSGITPTTANCGGNVTSDGGLAVTARGVCWATHEAPTTSDNITLDGSGTGSYSSVITGLSPNTDYYVRAYATNASTTVYGEQRPFRTPSGPISVSTNPVTSITSSTATCGGRISSDGGSTITQKGVCWNTTGSPTISNAHTNDGSGSASFTSNMTGLSPNTTYYVKAYVTDAGGNSHYGEQREFETPGNKPSLTTKNVTEITLNSAYSGGDISSDGGSSITAKGICWNTSGSPTLADPYTSNGSGTSSFTAQMTGLAENTTYYVSAYATNSVGTTYATAKSFKTETNQPTANFYASQTIVSVNQVVNFIDQSTGTPYRWMWNFGDGGSSFDRNPSHTYTSEGVYTVSLQVVNAYGSDTETKHSYITVGSSGSTVYDPRDGKTYNTVKIGDQWWMAENLNYGTYLNSSVSQTNNASVEKYCYDNNSSNCNSHGGIYTWPELMNYYYAESSQGICPSGWHVPSDAEWQTLEKALGMSSSDASSTGWRGPDQADALQVGASSGFESIKAGCWHIDWGGFGGAGTSAYYWTSTTYGEPYFRRVSQSDTDGYGIGRWSDQDRNNFGLYVRCVKD